MTPPGDAPLILFGAFDRHNFGDLLLAHVAAARAGTRPVAFAGLAERDLRPQGGHRVQAIAELAAGWQARWGGQPADLCHVGGELLTCPLYEAAVMLLAPDQAAQAIARYDAAPARRLAWARAQLRLDPGLDQRIAYLVPKALFRHPGRFSLRAVGGVDLARLASDQRAEVAARLGEADALSVRDRVTQAHLARLGIQAPLASDPGVGTAALFAGEIGARAGAGEPAAVAARFPQGYLACQCSADFGDDASLALLARQLDQAARDSGLGLVLFRAGAAPWHDDMAVYRRLLDFMPSRPPAHLFASPHLWDICALLAGARAYCGSSLHGRIVAQAWGVPGVSLLHADPTPETTRGMPGKQQAYWDTWPSWDRREDCAPRALAGPGQVHGAVMAALGADLARLGRLAEAQAAEALREIL